jgi:hypothetical protein
MTEIATAMDLSTKTIGHLMKGVKAKLGVESCRHHQAGDPSRHYDNCPENEKLSFVPGRFWLAGSAACIFSAPPSTHPLAHVDQPNAGVLSIASCGFHPHPVIGDFHLVGV